MNWSGPTEKVRTWIASLLAGLCAERGHAPSPCGPGGRAYSDSYLNDNWSLVRVTSAPPSPTTMSCLVTSATRMSRTDPSPWRWPLPLLPPRRKNSFQSHRLPGTRS